MTDHNEAMRLAQALKNRQEVEDDAADMLMQQAEQIDQLRAEVERLHRICVEQAQALIDRPVKILDAARTTHKDTE